MLSKIWKPSIVIVGALLGYGYYHFIGCGTGTCPITGNPWISTGYGALFALVLVLSSRNKRANRK